MVCFNISTCSLVSSPSEQYQHEIALALAGIEGVENILDNIVVHGPDTETHNRRLHQTIERLQECGLTLNAEKCLFNTDRLVFMGMLLSEKGIGPTADRVKAVLEVEEPKSASDVRSFLGLANYSSRFIPHFATLSEPLRRLTRKETEDQSRRSPLNLSNRRWQKLALGHISIRMHPPR